MQMHSCLINHNLLLNEDFSMKFPIDLMQMHSCLTYHNLLLNKDLSMKFSNRLNVNAFMFDLS